MNEEKKIIEKKSVEIIYENLLIIFSFLVMWDTKETEMIKIYGYMSHSQMFQKVESGWGPIFKVILEC